MRIESKLCHITENKAVVKVNGWLNENKIGSALAEASTVEVAEDKAISRLKKRINGEGIKEENSIHEDKINKTIKVELPRSQEIEKTQINNEPSDWSNELTAIDAEIQRLKWSREEEIIFLKNTLGYNNRNKITNYNDIIRYLGILKKTDVQQPLNIINENIITLIKESDRILRDLSWDNIQGREYLQKEFNVSTRKELNESQLILFVEKLKTILNQ